MTTSSEPERAMVRRVTPFVLPAGIIAFSLGAVTGGWGAGWSAAIGVAVVFLNFAAHGMSLAWAARISLNVFAATAMGGFVLRLAAVVAVLVWLIRFDWFSPLAFGLAVVPATASLLAFEIRLLARGLGRELILPPESSVGP
jgi:hypothetical protein